MGNLSNYVTITISRSSVGLTKAGFGTALVLSPNVTWATDRTRSFSNIDAVVADGGVLAVTTSGEYRAASALFGQSVSPKRIKFGKLANKPTLVYELRVLTVTDSHAYVVNVAGKGVTPTASTFTSGVGTTNDLIVAGLVTQLNLVVGKNYTAAATGSVGSQIVTLTATAAGDWFSCDIMLSDGSGISDLKCKMTHVDPGVQADLSAIKLKDGDFYAVYNLFNSNAMATEIATWTETNKKFFMCDSNESEVITTATGNSEIFDDLKTAARTRTAAFWHHRPDQMAGAALLGRCLPLTPGSETWADKALSGVDPSLLTDTHRDNLEDRNAFGYESVGGLGTTFFGTVASGEYIDAIRFLDSFENDAAVSIFNLKYDKDAKIPMTNPGIAQIESELRGACKRGENAGGIAPGWTVTAPDEADLDPDDVTARNLDGVTAIFSLQGAVHTVNVRANVIA